MNLKYDIEQGHYILTRPDKGDTRGEVIFNLTLSNNNTMYILDLIEVINPELKVECLVPTFL